MRRLLLLAALHMAVVLVLAPAAMAQAPVPGSAECPETRVTPDGIQCIDLPDATPTTTQYEQYAQENPLPYTSQREAAGECRAQGLLANETGACIAPATTPVTETATAPTTETATTTLPATGGTSLLLPAAVLLLGSGILVLAVARRKS